MAKSWRVEPMYLGNYRYSWKMVCGFWAHYQPPFFWLYSFTPKLNAIFVALFFFLFLSFPCCLLLNRQTHCIQSLSNSRYQGGLLCHWNRGCQVAEIPLNRVLFNRWIKFSKWVDIKNKLNLTKIGSATMVFPSPSGPPNFKLLSF